MSFRLRRIRNESTKRVNAGNNPVEIMQDARKSNRRANSFLNHGGFQCHRSEDRYSAHKSRKSLILNNFPSIFADSPSKQSFHSLQKELKSENSLNNLKTRDSQLKKKQKRVESLNNLLLECSNIQEQAKTTRVSLSSNRKVKESIHKLRVFIEKHEEKSLEKINHKNSEILVKGDIKILRDELGVETSRHRLTNKRIWKFSTPAITKKTEKLLASVETKLNPKKLHIHK